MSKTDEGGTVVEVTDAEEFTKQLTDAGDKLVVVRAMRHNRRALAQSHQSTVHIRHIQQPHNSTWTNDISSFERLNRHTAEAYSPMRSQAKQNTDSN